MTRANGPEPGPVRAGHDTLLSRRLAPAAERALRSLRRRLRQSAKREAIRSGRLTMGRYSYGTPVLRAYTGDAARVRIGAFVSIAEEVQVYLGGNHRPERVTSYPPYLAVPGVPYEPPATKGDVSIGNDVWLGRGATILSGVTIGDGAVVGAHSVVGGDVRAYAIVVGNPAREVGRRFSDHQVEALLRIAWWEWPIELIRERAGLLFDERIDEFVAAYGEP